MMLAGAANLDVVAEAADGREVLGAVDLHRPDVVLIDIRMPQLALHQPRHEPIDQRRRIAARRAH
jgi:DNA-binding NarL/FixJ family response regulator